MLDERGGMLSPIHTRSPICFPLIVWLGGAMSVYNQPRYGFWDALIWMYYVGRYIAIHFTALT